MNRKVIKTIKTVTRIEVSDTEILSALGHTLTAEVFIEHNYGERIYINKDAPLIISYEHTKVEESPS